MKKLAAFDLVTLGYLAIISLIVVAVRPPGAWVFLALHAAAALWVGMIIAAHGRYGGPFWTFFRYWYVLPFVLCAFREIHYLVPLVHPFDDRHAGPTRNDCINHRRESGQLWVPAAKHRPH